MQKTIPIEHGKFYHIYNCGINGEDLFREKENYIHFLRQYEKYIDTIADTFAWVLMRNHFHFLIRIKEEEEIGFYKPLNADSSDDSVKFQVTTNLSAFEEADSVKVKPNPYKHFSHLFNAYTKHYNPKYNRSGNLFRRPFKRKPINTENYFRQVVLYIHNNPVHRGFADHPIEYPWSSYQTCISIKPTRLKRETVIGWFDNLANFKVLHQQKVEYLKIENWLEI